MDQKTFTNNKFEFVNQNAEWFFQVTALLSTLDNNTKVPKFPLIKKENYENLGQKEQTELLKTMLADILDYLQLPKNKNLLCPFHADNNPSMQYSKGSIFCYSCMQAGKHLDIFDIIKIIFALDTFTKQKQKAVELFVKNGVEITSAMEVKFKSSTNNSNTIAIPKSAENALSKKIYVDIQDDNDGIAYLGNERGITLDTAKKFKLKVWTKLDKYLIIPCADGYNVRRRFTNIQEDSKKFWNKKDVAITLFNAQALEAAQLGEPILIFESAIDAMSADQIASIIGLKINVIALNGVENISLLLDKVNVILEKNLQLILWCDRDGAGVNGFLSINNQLKRKNVNSFVLQFGDPSIWDNSIFHRNKDLNEALVKDKQETEEAFRFAVKFALDKYKAKFLTIYPSPTTSSGNNNPFAGFRISTIQTPNK